MWVPPEETDPILLHEPTRRSIALFGAVNLHGGQMHALFCEPFNGDTFVVFLETLQRRRRKGGRMVVISDNAAYHKSPPVQGFLAEHHPNLQLLYLPPYSPDLNPIEQVFAKLKHLLRLAQERTVEASRQTIGALLTQFTPQECANYFTNAGYA